MTTTKPPSFLSDLRAFARKCIAADRFPNDYHVFRMFECDTCGAVPLALTIEHHTGSKKSNFRGIILAQCSVCDATKRVFGFTGEHRSRLREEKPVCVCGNEHFLVGECERIEGEEGLFGFSDESVVVGRCSVCGQNRALVYVD